MRYEKSSLCQLGWLSCMGCCGHHFKDKIEVAKGIEKNTLEYGWSVRKGQPVTEWINRSKDLRKSGVCRNLVYDVEKDVVYCPAHPEVNGGAGKDPRLDHHYCDILHVCKTAFFFDLWDNDRKKEFTDFLKKKKKAGELDWYKYSMKMADDSLLEEFEGLRW
ncbi:hypothetical protein KY362_02975 [Candidatus Woesearchaeota archaeon]|nr:hypothetical protein [Candidatus Woesearchaeota archaeon]